MRGSFKKYAHFGFFIPEKRDFYGGDFYVTKHNDKGALDGQRVIAKELPKTKGKKPEAKIMELLSKDKIENPSKHRKVVTGVYVENNGEFGFIEIKGKEKGYFVHASKKKEALHGDIVTAEISSYNGKPEAITLTSNPPAEEEAIVGELKDNGDFGFVYTKKGQDDIFVSASNYNGAVNGDTVEVRVTKIGERKPEGVIIKIK